MAMTGAWDFSSLKPEPLPEEVKNGLKSLQSTGFVGSTIEPIKLLGQQVVNGVNYAVLVKITPMTLYAQTHLAVIEFNYKLNEGKYKLVKHVDINL